MDEPRSRLLAYLERRWISPGFRTSLGLHVLLVLLCSFALAMVGRYGRNVPWWDEWAMVGVLGDRPVTLEWLWAVHAVHRLPIPRLVYISVMRLVGNDFRALMVVNVVVLGLAAMFLLRAARALRGSPRWTDAALPLALLHWGHSENMLWGFQIGFILSILLFSMLVALMCGTSRPLGTSRVLGAVLLLLLLPLQTSQGLLLAVGAAPWLAVIGFIGIRAGGPERRAGALALVGLAGVLGLVLACRMGLPVPGLPAPYRLLRVATQFFTAGLGPVGRDLLPVSPVLTLLVLFATAVLLGRRILSSADRRLADWAVAAALLAVLAVGLGVAVGRARSMGFALRYVTLAAPFWCVVQLAWSARGGSRPGRAMSAAIAIVFLAALPVNMAQGLRRSADVSGRLKAFEMDVWSGVSTAELARRHAGSIFPALGEENLARGIANLQRSHLGPFDRPFHEHEDDLLRHYESYFREHRAGPWLPVLLEDEENRAHLAFLSPALSTMSFPVPPGKWTVRATFGLRSAAWASGVSDGVDFLVRVRDPGGGERELFRRELRPTSIESDRGSHTLEISFDTESDAQVEFVTTRGPARSRAADWSYWSNLSITRNP